VLLEMLDLLAPPLCWSCGAPAARASPVARASPLCRACRARLRFLPPGPVVLCGLEVWAPVAYDGPARELVKALKFHGATRLAGQMAALIVANAPAGLLRDGPGSARGPGRGPARGPAGGAALVPVPLHPARRRARPFNQAQLIAQAVAARTGLAVEPCLTRLGPPSRQVGRGRAERLHGPAGAVEASGRAPPVALLVDDVATTGGTLAACAAALRSAGAEHVSAIVFARTAGR
jgi:predicted amidophosphoribosyltransferase